MKRLFAATLLLLAVIVGFALWVHPFLSVTHRIEAEVMAVEGWVPEEVLRETVTEFRQGRYSHVFVSGMMPAPDPSYRPHALEVGPARVARRLAELGIPAELIHEAPAPFTSLNRTAATARGVRTKIQEMKLQPKGILLISGGPHSRQSWLAYRRIMSEVSPVGVVAIRTGHYDPEAWWLSGQGLRWVLKDFAGWVKEVLVGPRS